MGYRLDEEMGRRFGVGGRLQFKLEAGAVADKPLVRSECPIATLYHSDPQALRPGHNARHFADAMSKFKFKFQQICSQGSNKYQQASFGSDYSLAWWRHQMETYPALLALCEALCEGNPPVSGGFGGFPSRRPVTRSFDDFFICVWTNS